MAVLVVLLVVWVASLAYRLSPSLQRRFPGLRVWAHVIGWASIIAILLITFLT